MSKYTDDHTRYWCIKCRRHHYRHSNIGKWHEPLIRPELYQTTRGISKEKPTPLQYATALAIAIALQQTDKSEIRYETFEDIYYEENFDDFGSVDDGLNALQNEFAAVITRRHTGQKWIALEASTTNNTILKRKADNYKHLGMQYGVRKIN